MTFSRLFAPWRNLASLPREAWILFWTNLINRAGTMVLPFLVLYLTREKGLSPGQAGMVLASYGIAGIVAAPLAGKLSDMFGPLLLMRVSLLASGVMLLVYQMANSFATLIAVTLVWSVADVGYRPASLAFTTQFVPPEQRKAAFALTRLAINLGMSIGPAVGGFLAAVSFGTMFIVDGITTLAGAVILILFRSTSTPAASEPDGPAFEVRDSGTPLRDSSYLLFLIGVVLISIVFFQHEGALPLYIVEDLRRSPAFYGFLFTINTLMIVLMEVPLNLATSHWSHRRSLTVGSALITAGFGALVFADSAAAVIVTVVIWTFGEMIWFPAAAAYLGDRAPARQRGRYMGLFSMSTNLGFAAGTWLGAALFASIGALRLWLFMLVLGTIATLVQSVATESRR